MEDALLKWLKRVQTDVPISDELLREKAKRFWHVLDTYKEMEMPQLSAGWLYKFKRRHGVKQYIRHGEAGDVDEAAVSEQIKLLQSLVQNYHPADVYNCDETGLFWKSTPDRGLATQQFSGTKQNKSRITAHFCCNADGSDKVPVWIIGKSAWPRAFTAAKVNLASLGCHWRYNGKAWMNTELFIQWL